MSPEREMALYLVERYPLTCAVISKAGRAALAAVIGLEKTEALRLKALEIVEAAEREADRAMLRSLGIEA